MEGGFALSRVIAAIDNSAAAKPVLSVAAAVARLFHAKLEAIHTQQMTDAVAARAAAESAGVRPRLITGPTVRTIVEEARLPDVVAVVLGTRGTPGGRRPAGHIATEVATSVSKPVVVVPPDCVCPVQLRRLLVPLEPDMVTAAALRATIEAAYASGAEIVVLHVFEDRELPLFNDQPQHEVEAWVTEFLRRYCPYVEGIRVELRTGVPREHVLAVAEEIGADALVLGWGQRLVPGRAKLVRTALEHSHIPVILVPVLRQAGTEGQKAGAAAVAGGFRID
jgi:nucleotide-binding universal stress UspA family protein